MINQVCGYDIDFSKIDYVGPIGGDSSWLKYKVYFSGGYTLEFYEERETNPMHYKREDFILKWKSNRNQED